MLTTLLHLARFPLSLSPAAGPTRAPFRALSVASTCLTVLGGLAAGVSAQEILRDHAGPAHSGFGLVAAAGDVDGDGVHDTLVGAPGDSGAGALAGSVHVLSGADGSVLHVLPGAAAGERFGASGACAGDVDGDGHDDLIIGAPGADRAYLHSGADGALIRVLQGAAGSAFGQAVAGVGDVDGDGLCDVAVGAPLADVGGADTGTLSIVSGGTGATLHVVSGGKPGDQYGASISGNLTGECMVDNQGDVIVGATADGGDKAGYVQALSKSGFGLSWQVAGDPGEQLGAAVVNVGDVDGDGVLDIAAGSDPRDANGQASGPATVRLYSGADGTLLREHSDGLVGSGYGTVLAALGDVTGDGVPDLGVGAPLAGANGEASGTVRLYSGADGTAWYTIHGPAAGARFGARLAYGVDANGDAVPDPAVGAPGAAYGSGRVWTLSVSRWSDVGSGLPGVEGIPTLSGTGGLIGSTEATLTLTGARASTTATLVLGFALVLDAGSGTLVPTVDASIPGLLTSNAGQLVYTFVWPEGCAPGTTVYHQFLVSDPEAPGGLARSNTVAGSVP